MQLEAGKKYVDRRGRVYGPLAMCSVYFGESTGHAFWDSSGSVLVGCKSDLDLVAEYVEPAPVGSPDDWVILPPKTRTVTLKEYACWDDSDASFVTIEWTSGDPSQSSSITLIRLATNEQSKFLCK